jgi:hypothetical protein
MAERDVMMKEVDLELDADTVDHLIEYAKKNIVKDVPALINWAVTDILQQIIDTNGKVLEDIKNGEGNG